MVNIVMIDGRWQRRSRRRVRAVDSPVPGRWVEVSESWGCDVLCAVQ